MKHSRFLTILCAAGLVFGSVPAFAETIPDPDYPDVLLLQSDSTAVAEEGDPLTDVINQARAANNALPVGQSEVLNALAQQRVEELEQTNGCADASMITNAFAAPASETVIRGKADLNTMISALMLSEQQMKNLVYSRYAQFGYACNESQTVWVILFAEPAPSNTN